MRMISADDLEKALREAGLTEVIKDDCSKCTSAWGVPTVDAEPVVRCKDCYYCVTEKSFDKEYLYCDAFYEYAEGDLIGVSLMVEPNHFCSWGERREDEID